MSKYTLIALSASHFISFTLVLWICFWIKYHLLVDILLSSHYLFAWKCIVIVKKNSFLVFGGDGKVKIDFCLMLLFFKSSHCFFFSLNPFTPTSDQDRISPYNINTISSRQVMRIEKIINHGIISWSNTKFS